jgi:hypothetical protein
MKTRTYLTIIGSTAVLSFASSSFAQHPGDVWVARNSNLQLAVGGFALADVPTVLPPSGGLFPGWSDNDPGFDRIVTAQPENDLFPMSAGAQVHLVVVEFDPALRAIDTGFNVIDSHDESTLLGSASLHTHLTWNININDGAFDDEEYLWEATFVLRDMGSTGYTDSESVTLKFLNVDRIAGDINGDEIVDLLDIPEFIALLFDDSTATREVRAAADMNLDRSIDGADIQGFVAALLEAI